MLSLGKQYHRDTARFKEVSHKTEWPTATWHSVAHTRHMRLAYKHTMLGEESNEPGVKACRALPDMSLGGTKQDRCRRHGGIQCGHAT